ncbi:hypothetical protein BV25DRAFT_723840 [Artomyces pyxidatus]|uniref:Uncharacterized protein n=1 Tax=Artomyces pyxidatus TaxID=48021 RepID=A0ACB8SD75_9AGAM|nr:hypothetical protein BV25DRAFT_723840 [Artomyces pyxidatus]
MIAYKAASQAADDAMTAAAADPTLLDAAMATSKVAKDALSAYMKAARAHSTAAARATALKTLPDDVVRDMQEAEETDQVWNPPVYEFEMKPDDKDDFEKYVAAVQQVYNDVRHLVLRRFKHDGTDHQFKDNYYSEVPKAGDGNIWDPVIFPRNASAFWFAIRRAARHTAYNRIDGWEHHPNPPPNRYSKKKRPREEDFEAWKLADEAYVDADKVLKTGGRDSDPERSGICSACPAL